MQYKIINTFTTDILNYTYIYNRYFAEIRTSNRCLNLPKDWLLAILDGKEFQQITPWYAIKFDLAEHEHWGTKNWLEEDLVAWEWTLGNLINKWHIT